MRVVIDTNIWVSYLINPFSGFSDRIDSILRDQTVLYSDSTMREVLQVLSRPKFGKFITATTIYDFYAAMIERLERVKITENIKACTDPDDDKFLELAVSGKADVILTGDSDLLSLDPFRGIRIIRPGEWDKTYPKA